jgi:UDP-N-acetylmuramyl pentapeptide phosphotransferase/UDP-N-acetylglucosamine-1-phosphate transferase
MHEITYVSLEKHAPFFIILFNMFLGNIYPALIGFLVTLVVGVVIIRTQGWHGSWTHDSHEGVQKFHKQPTPRIGGLAIFFGVLVAVILAEEGVKALFLQVLIASLIPFFAGFMEDVTRRVSIRNRLLASVVGSLGAIFLTGHYLHYVDIPALDFLMNWWPVGVFVTIIAITGLTNAINILDGFNGLAMGAALVILFSLGLIGFRTNDFLVVNLCLILFLSILGLFFLNYPLGKIFLGDGGAYFIGFFIAWISLLLPVRNSNVSPWASLLACAYPVVEVLYSMARRMSVRKSAGHPDNLHLHTLIKTRLVRQYFQNFPGWARNSLVALPIWCVSFLLGSSAVIFFSNKFALITLFFLFLFLYHLSYRYLMKLNLV